MPKSFYSHLEGPTVLITTEAAVRAGGCALRLERSRRAEPFLAQAQALRFAALRATRPADLLRMSDIQAALLTAAGVSDATADRLEDVGKAKAVRMFVEGFLEPEANFVEELVFRFLLTRGDTLGGSMRNLGGVVAQRRFTRAIISWFGAQRVDYSWMDSRTGAWAGMSQDDSDIDLHLRGLSWYARGKPRTLIYNLTVPLVRNNVDLCLFDCTPEQLSKKTHKTPSAYLALGELKGGIDPAGADEHWKTARTALGRIHTSFAKHKAKPMTFFIGAAIESKMATEIWAMPKKGELTNAANLTDDVQLASITRWLCSL